MTTSLRTVRSAVKQEKNLKLFENGLLRLVY